MIIVVGVGGSGPLAQDTVRAALHALQGHPQFAVRSTSRLYANPAVGGKTSAGFVNAAVVVDTALSQQALVLALHAIESRLGRVRGDKDAARSLDLDILWSTTQVAAVPWPAVPHPRLLLRPFAFVPAIEALERAGHAVPPALAAARARTPSTMLSAR